MTVQSAQSVTVLFTTRNAATSTGVNADSLPVGTLYLNGTANGASVTVTNISTGLYKAAVTMPTLAAGDQVELSIAATVAAISDTGIVWGDTNDFIGSAGALTTVTTATNLTTYTGNTPQTGDVYARLGAPAGASISADVAAVKTDTAAVKTQTDKMAFSVTNQIDANIKGVNSHNVTGDGHTGTEWGPA
jgi:hypothetical protein